MQFVLTLNLNGAAFHEGQEPHDEGAANGYAVAELLTQVAEQIRERGDINGPYPVPPQQIAIPGDQKVIWDGWGNTCGKWEVTG